MRESLKIHPQCTGLPTAIQNGLRLHVSASLGADMADLTMTAELYIHSHGFYKPFSKFGHRKIWPDSHH